VRDKDENRERQWSQVRDKDETGALYSTSLVWSATYPVDFIQMMINKIQMVDIASANKAIISEGQETGAIALDPKTPVKKFEGRG
jgi:hypothetical protein